MLQIQIALHSALRAKSQVQLSSEVSLSNVLIVRLPKFSLNVCFYSDGFNYYRYNLFFEVHEPPQLFLHLLFPPSDSFIRLFAYYYHYYVNLLQSSNLGAVQSNNPTLYFLNIVFFFTFIHLRHTWCVSFITIVLFNQQVIK